MNYLSMFIRMGAKSIELLKDTTLLDIQKKLQKVYLAYIDDMPVSDMKQTLDTIAHLHQKVKFSSGYDFGFKDNASTASKMEAGRKKIWSQFTEHRMYENWFAMEIYSCLATTDSTDLANRVQKILDFKNYPEEMSDREETYTSVLCSAFDKFLPSDHCCLRQMPLPTTE